MRSFLFSFVAPGCFALVIAGGWLLMSGCSSGTSSEVSDSLSKNDSLDTTIITRKLKNDTVLMIDGRKVILKAGMTDAHAGTILVLHGWNLPPEDWCTKTSLCEKATKLGYCLVLPDMGKSNYQKQTFPETRPDWAGTPKVTWLTDTVIPKLQKEYGLLLETEPNYVMGLSTGGRGVAIMVLEMPKLFKAAAALSGDFDQTKIPNDKVIIGFYGPYEQFKDRWQTADNAVNRIKEFNTPFYIGHGTQDKVCPPQQSRIFYDSLVKNHPKLDVRFHNPVAAHDYPYWDSEVDSILHFFGKYK
jgi:predicted esterase